jgi:hypothetical protein
MLEFPGRKCKNPSLEKLKNKSKKTASTKANKNKKVLRCWQW